MGISHLGLQRLVPLITEDAPPYPTDNLELLILPDGSWFQQSDGTIPSVLDNDVIGYQTDGTGNGNNPIQATTSKKPVVINGVANGQRIARYDLTDDLLATLAPVTELLTIFIVAANASAGFPSGNHFVFTQDTGNLQLFQTSGGGGLVRLQSGLFTINDATAWGTSFKIAMIRAAPGSLQLYFNGSLAGSAAGYNSHTGAVTIGNHPSLANGWGGDVGGLMGYTSTLSDDDSNQVGNFLGDLFGISWSDL